MSRIVVFVLALVFLGGCAKGGDEGSQTASNTPAPGGNDPGTERPTANLEGRPKGKPAITDDEFSEFEALVNASLRPYFDGKGTQTEVTVAPGEYFDVYVFAEYNELYPMSAAEYRLILPKEVSVMGSVNTDSTIASVGRYDVDFGIAFHCMPHPKWWVAKYTCKAHDDFDGGTIEVARGTGLDFIGFVTCDATRTMVRAKGGTAVLSKK